MAGGWWLWRARAGEWVLAGATLPHHVGQWAGSGQPGHGRDMSRDRGVKTGAPPATVPSVSTCL